MRIHSEAAAAAGAWERCRADHAGLARLPCPAQGTAAGAAAAVASTQQVATTAPAAVQAARRNRAADPARSLRQQPGFSPFMAVYAFLPAGFTARANSC